MVSIEQLGGRRTADIDFAIIHCRSRTRVICRPDRTKETKSARLVSSQDARIMPRRRWTPAVVGNRYASALPVAQSFGATVIVDGLIHHPHNR